VKFARPGRATLRRCEGAMLRRIGRGGRQTSGGRVCVRFLREGKSTGRPWAPASTPGRPWRPPLGVRSRVDPTENAAAPPPRSDKKTLTLPSVPSCAVKLGASRDNRRLCAQSRRLGFEHADGRQRGIRIPRHEPSVLSSVVFQARSNIPRCRSARNPESHFSASAPYRARMARTFSPRVAQAGPPPW
jgi:hypothetical protein